MYRWLKDGVPLEDYSHSQYYRLQNTNRRSAGFYQCLAKNDAGIVFSKKIEVIVACKFDFTIYYYILSV